MDDRVDDLWDQINLIRTTAERAGDYNKDTRAMIVAHEAVCTERYKNMLSKQNLILAALVFIVTSQLIGLPKAIELLFKSLVN